jgi:hypothetical protein
MNATHPLAESFNDLTPSEASTVFLEDSSILSAGCSTEESERGRDSLGGGPEDFCEPRLFLGKFFLGIGRESFFGFKRGTGSRIGVRDDELR